ncbi:MAG TPA: LytTR family DNA-binding domain-containing protein [Thermoanaerobaculia bacterium]
MRVLVVDDEPVARRRLMRMLGRIEGVSVAGEAVDGEDALDKIVSLEPDVVLLDIRMPGLDGLAVARRKGLPPVIFTTAHAEHAVEAFEAAAVDYLLKPINQERLEQAIDRVRRRNETLDRARLALLLEKLGAVAHPPVRLAVRRGDSRWLIDARTISRLRSADKYVVARHEGKELVLDESLGELEERLSPQGFCRIHRGELVNLDHVRAVHRTLRGLFLELEGGDRVPVSRRRAGEVLERLGVR